MDIKLHLKLNAYTKVDLEKDLVTSEILNDALQNFVTEKELEDIINEFIKNSNSIESFESKSEFPIIGDSNKIYKDSSEGVFYQWNPNTGSYEPLNECEFCSPDLIFCGLASGLPGYPDPDNEINPILPNGTSSVNVFYGGGPEGFDEKSNTKIIYGGTAYVPV